ncbi:glutathione S-transferase family protein [Rhizobium sp. S152]|uniref:glutathione S-transferase family protein n=1 Tax=Rhizobium sp. S152 TaxID=3055038 RepID=UPI0025AA078A|nr:glutathione S-transferase family protein [Rhizobium sp. S152]MDM9628513.1 glutathione S-transferase family protein [Rhizobium sp. S152]
MNEKVTLYGAKTGNCLRAAIALEEAGVQYETRHVDLKSAEHKTSEFARLNPIGKVPVLTVEAPRREPLVLTQSNAIMMWAAERSNGVLLPQASDNARARVIERLFFFITDVIAPSHASFALVGEDQRKAMRLLDDKAMQAIHHSERFVAETTYMAGNTFSITDIAAVTMILSVRSRINWPDLPALSRWLALVLGRPGVDCGMRAFD